MSNSENQTTGTQNAAINNSQSKENLMDSIISLMRDDKNLAKEVYEASKGLLQGNEQDASPLKAIDQLEEIVKGMKKDDGHVLIIATRGEQSIAMVRGNRIELGSAICTAMEQDKDFAAIFESSVMVHNMFGGGTSNQPDPMDIFQGMGGLRRDPIVEFLDSLRNKQPGMRDFQREFFNNPLPYPKDEK